MKSIKLAVLAIALVGIFGVGNAFAAGSATITVSATVLGTCSFDTASYDMNFGNIATSDTGDKTATVDLAFTCSNGTPYTLDDLSGSQSMTSGSGSLAYSIDVYTTTGTGSGSAQTVGITGRILQGAYSIAAADVYSDTLTINITP